MDVQTADRLRQEYPLDGTDVAEGKTKKIRRLVGDDRVSVFSKDDITAGDGLKHDLIQGKGVLANETTCHIFRLLKECGLPVAFVEQDGPDSFIAPECQMLPYEVVVRREALGSYLKRHPYLQRRHYFPKLVVEFYLKTKDRDWKGIQLICDDPLMQYVQEADEIQLFDPAKPIHGQQPFLTLPASEVFTAKEQWKHFPKMERLAKVAFLILEKAWQILGFCYVDFKVEFGRTLNDELLLADTIDSDSGRLLDQAGKHVDKQYYRDGGDLDNTKRLYELVANLTSQFKLPRQQIILWRGSASDNMEAFLKAVEAFGAEFPQNFDMPIVTHSAHKEPAQAIEALDRMLQAVPNSVVIVYVGLSNAAGPMLSATSTATVIAVPASITEFSDDVWSSLRTPGDVPVSVVLRPANAIMNALQILSLNNPFFYALLRERIEKRRVNTLLI